MADVPDVGEVFTTVIVHPNVGEKRDPVSKVNGRTVFIRYPERENDHVEMGDHVRARMADVRDESACMAVLVEEL